MDVQFQLALLIKRKALYLKMMNFLFKPILLKAIKFLKFKMRPCLYIFIQDQLFMCKKGISKAYAYHFWADLPNNLYQSLLLSKFEQSQIFKALLSQGSSVGSDYILESRIDSFEQVVDENENYVSISISINFIDAKESKIIAHRLFSIKERVKKIDIFDVYQSFEKALNSLGNEIVLWINATLDEK